MSLSATLEDLSLKNKPLMWAPTAASTKRILQQSKYTDLAGSQERTGDLKSIVLHKISLDEVKSTFPVSTGLRITGVDENTFASTGEAFSTIVMPKHASTTPKVLQEDDVAAAYAGSTDVDPRAVGRAAGAAGASLCRMQCWGPAVAAAAASAALAPTLL